MGPTGKFKFRKALWGKIVLQIEEEVKPFWSRSKPVALKRCWRDAPLMDLADPQMRPLIDMRFRPHLRSQSSFASEATSAPVSSTKLMEESRRRLRARMGRCAGSRTEGAALPRVVGPNRWNGKAPLRSCLRGGHLTRDRGSATQPGPE
jgi:hypothetical protein